MNTDQYDRIRSRRGFFAALDQSGGSTPKALAEYGISQARYSCDQEMFDLVHAMRTRIVTSAAFDGSRILGSILFEQTMDRTVQGVPTAEYLWRYKQVVPFLKVDSGLDEARDGVQLMKPIDGLDQLVLRAKEHGIFGTKMRSVILHADKTGVAAVVDQQVDYAMRIAAAGLIPILEPEVSIGSADKQQAEALLRDALQTRIDSLPDCTVMVKLTIPTQPDLYAELARHPSVLRLLALSGGYDRNKACELLARDSTMIASFSRALLQGLSDGQTADEFDAQLAASVEQIFHASDKDPVHARPTAGRS